MEEGEARGVGKKGEEKEMEEKEAFVTKSFEEVVEGAMEEKDGAGSKVWQCKT